MGEMGRPLILLSFDADRLEELCDEYFDSRWSTRKIHGRDGQTWDEEFMRPPTYQGLALHLGVTRTTLWRFMKSDDEKNEHLKPVIARALARIAEFAEEALYTQGGANGAKFALEVNHRYGKEDEGGDGAGFSQNIITPAVSSDGDVPLAIPHWSDDE